MYCDQCGTNMGSGQVCPGCGKNFVPMMPPAHKLDGHIRLLGILWLSLAALRVIPGVLLIVGSTLLVGLLPPEFPPFLVAALPLITVLLWINLLGGALVGYALLTHQPWGRIAAIIMAILNLWEVPFGTGVSVYTLWALLPADHERQYRQMSEITPAGQSV